MRIIWVYNEWQPDYEKARAKYPHIEFMHCWTEEIYDCICPDKRNLFIVDN